MVKDTLPKLLRRNYERYGDKNVAMRRNIIGIWKKYTWKDYKVLADHKVGCYNNEGCPHEEVISCIVMS